MRRFVAAVCVALTLAGVLAVLPVADAGALAPHRVSMTPSKVAVDVPGSLRLSGSVPTASPGKGIVIDQLFGAVWRPVTLGRTDGARRYSIGFVPRSPGYIKLRARVSGDRSHGAAVSSASTIAVYRWHYLRQLAPVDGSFYEDRSPNVGIDGIVRSNTITLYSFTPGCCAGDRAVWNLRRQCTTFRAVAGMLDSEPSSSGALFLVNADGASGFSRVLRLGDSAQITVNVAGRLRVELWAQEVSGLDTAYSGFGDARIRCLW